VTSRARQREQADALVRGHGVIVAEFFDAGQSRTVAWARRPEAAALVALLADPDRGWDAIVVGEYERAFYGSQYAAMAPLFEHYDVQLWMPEAFCLAAFCLAGRPPGYGGDRRVGLVQRLRCPGGWITALGGQREAMHERPGQRQGDSQQQPHPQAPGEKCPHAQSPFVVPREVPRRYPPCPGLTTSRAACYSSRTW
jgi:hypothetical protein